MHIGLAILRGHMPDKRCSGGDSIDQIGRAKWRLRYFVNGRRHAVSFGTYEEAERALAHIRRFYVARHTIEVQLSTFVNRRDFMHRARRALWAVADEMNAAVAREHPASPFIPDRRHLDSYFTDIVLQSRVIRAEQEVVAADRLLNGLVREINAKHV